MTVSDSSAYCNGSDVVVHTVTVVMSVTVQHTVTVVTSVTVVHTVTVVRDSR